MTGYGESILVVDDDPFIQQALKDRLESLGYPVLPANSGKRALEAFQRHEPNLVLLDIEMPDIKGIEVLKEFHRQAPDVPVVMITAYGSVDLVVEAMRAGAYDFIPKPFEQDQIAHVVEKAMERQRLKRGVEVFSQEIDQRHQLISGASPKLASAIATAKKAAAARSTVLLLGESGVGKEIFARAIHNWSERKTAPFVAINCVGIAKDLLENELFGHEKGAYTGAHERKKGKFEIANGGTVFLDEIGDISMEMQTKLLRFLEMRQFERVGGNDTISVDVRIVAATNRDLEAAVKTGQFREDLFYRLNVVAIELPPLRERTEDIVPLANYFLSRYAKECGKDFTAISQETIDRLLAHRWPGNVRELANIIERAVVMGKPPTINIEDLPTAMIADDPEAGAAPSSYHDFIEAFRRDLVKKTLDQNQGNRSATARQLGIERSYLLKLLKSLNIS